MQYLLFTLFSLSQIAPLALAFSVFTAKQPLENQTKYSYINIAIILILSMSLPFCVNYILTLGEIKIENTDTNILVFLSFINSLLIVGVNVYELIADKDLNINIFRWKIKLLASFKFLAFVYLINFTLGNLGLTNSMVEILIIGGIVSTLFIFFTAKYYSSIFVKSIEYLKIGRIWLILFGLIQILNKIGINLPESTIFYATILVFIYGIYVNFKMKSSAE